MESRVVCLDTPTVAHLYHKLHEAVLSLRSQLKIEAFGNADVVTRFHEQDGKLYVELTYWKDKEKEKNDTTQRD
jgi:hypothetical protein